jgi:hypothetical protein
VDSSSRTRLPFRHSSRLSRKPQAISNRTITWEDGVEPASFDPRETGCGAETGARYLHDARGQGQAGLEQALPSKIKELPKEVGVMLVTAGIVGFILPGPGTPAIIAGGLVLWPETFGKLESWLERRHPQVHREGMRHINRFLTDLEKRYPNSTAG